MAMSSECPSCGSPLLQPLRWEAKGEAEVQLDMRCPECLTWMQGVCTPAELEALDRAQAAGRDDLVTAYERSVTETMEALTACFAVARALDIVGADDFASRPRARGRVI